MGRSFQRTKATKKSRECSTPYSWNGCTPRSPRRFSRPSTSMRRHSGSTRANSLCWDGRAAGFAHQHTREFCVRTQSHTRHYRLWWSTSTPCASRPVHHARAVHASHQRCTLMTNEQNNRVAADNWPQLGIGFRFWPDICRRSCPWELWLQRPLLHPAVRDSREERIWSETSLIYAARSI